MRIVLDDERTACPTPAGGDDPIASEAVEAEVPPNPFNRAHFVPQEPIAGAATVTIREEHAKSILTRNNSPDIPFRWSVNPYRGCQHGCAYCYARRTHEYLGLGAGRDFETQLFVKINAPELLAGELDKPGWRREWLALSGVTDCYQPIEAQYELTRRCLAVCVERANPLGIVTKSELVARDIDLLRELHRRAEAHVLFSITFDDDDLAERIETGSTPPSRRFATMRALADAGIPVGINIAPVIPGLNDRNIPNLLRRAAACGATQAGISPVRLPGSVAQVFLSRLRRELPQAAARVEARIRDLRGGKLNDPRFGYRMDAEGTYWESIERLFELTATQLGLLAGQKWTREQGGEKWNREEKEAPRGVKQLPLFG